MRREQRILSSDIGVLWGPMSEIVICMETYNPHVYRSQDVPVFMYISHAFCGTITYHLDGLGADDTTNYYPFYSQSEQSNVKGLNDEGLLTLAYLLKT